VRGVQFRGKEVDESDSETGNPLRSSDKSHASGGIDALSACLPASPVRESRVAQEDSSHTDVPAARPSSGSESTNRLASSALGPESVPALRVACCYCGNEMSPGVEPTSHGCCPPCKDKVLADIRAVAARRKAAAK
jgi:hypothetical protein